MRNSRRDSSNSVERLRLAIDCLPDATREAMLVGLRANERILVGAYVDEQGGVCPMLAAHRCGGRTDFLSFAKSWDRFTRASGKSRTATKRELSILRSQLEASLQGADGQQLLARAIGEHRELLARRARVSRRLLRAAEPTGEILARRLRIRRPRTLAPRDSSAGAATKLAASATARE
jgi:hypothetical protein